MRSIRLYLMSILALIASTATAPAGPAPEVGQQPPRTRSLHLGLNKSAVITLDADVRDVIIPAPSIASAVVRSARTVYLTGERPGQTNAYFAGKDGEQLLRLDISVEPDHSQMLALIRRHVAGSRVRAEAIGDQIVLSGTVRNPIDAVQAANIAARFTGAADKVLNLINVTSQEQVLLKVTIAEANRTAIQRLGLDLKNLAVEAQRLGIAALTQSPFPITGGAAASTAYNVTARTITAPESGGVLTAVWQAGGANVHAVIEAMERDGQVRTLAEPSLTSISGETANFVAGGEFPVPVSRDNNSVSVSWKQFGVGLAFTPAVLSEGRISLKISTEVSSLTSDGAVTSNSISIPALHVRRASSTVELPSGGALVLAGLISEEMRRSADSVPGVNSIPVFGELLGSRDLSHSQTELLVVVTPYLVRAVHPGRLALPATPPPANTALLSNWSAAPEPLPRPSEETARVRRMFGDERP